MTINTRNLVLAAAVGVLLSGCNFGDDDKDELSTPNRTPNAMSVDLITQADTPIMDTAPATDPDGDSLTYSVATEPMLGSLTLNSDGSYTYTPNATVTGMDSFSFTVSDGVLTSAEGTVNITIEAQQVNFSTYSRAAFAQDPTDVPLPVNGREFTQDVTDPNAYDDLLTGQ